MECWQRTRDAHALRSLCAKSFKFVISVLDLFCYFKRRQIASGRLAELSATKTVKLFKSDSTSLHSLKSCNCEILNIYMYML